MLQALQRSQDRAKVEVRQVQESIEGQDQGRSSRSATPADSAFGRGRGTRDGCGRGTRDGLALAVIAGAAEQTDWRLPSAAVAAAEMDWLCLRSRALHELNEGVCTAYRLFMI